MFLYNIVIKIIEIIKCMLGYNIKIQNYWHDNVNKLHRSNDLPAIDIQNYFKKWVKHGKDHRNNNLPYYINLKDNNYIWIQRKPPLASEYMNGVYFIYNKNNSHMVVGIHEYMWYENQFKLFRKNNLPSVMVYNDKKMILEIKWYTPNGLKTIYEVGINNNTILYQNNYISITENEFSKRNFTVNSNGEMMWLKNNKLHREGDLPAYISKDKIYWCKNGKYHRDNYKPAVIRLINNEYKVDYY